MDAEGIALALPVGPGGRKRTARQVDLPGDRVYETQRLAVNDALQNSRAGIGLPVLCLLALIVRRKRRLAGVLQLHQRRALRPSLISGFSALTKVPRLIDVLDRWRIEVQYGMICAFGSRDKGRCLDRNHTGDLGIFAARFRS